MTAPSLTISIDRTALSLADLVLSAKRADGTALGVENFTEPALQARVEYAPPSLEQHGDLALSWTWQQSILGFDVFPADAASEDAAQAALDELRNAISQGLEFEVTVTKNGGTPQVWTCNPGSLVPSGGRTFVDLKRSSPRWSVTLPCYPVRG